MPAFQTGQIRKRRINSEEEKGRGRLPFQVTPGDSSFLIICIGANMCISVGWWLGISSSLTPRRVSGSLLHFPRKSFRLLSLVLPHPLAGSHLPLLDPLLRGQAWVTSNTPTCSHILELLALNRQARKRNKIFLNNKQITYAFPYQVDEYSRT